MTLDYRTGKNRWGHAMHPQTMRKAIPASFFARLKDRWEKAYRVQVMIHSPHYPEIGEHFLWSAKAGHDVKGVVCAVETCGDPYDMYTVYVKVRPERQT